MKKKPTIAPYIILIILLGGVVSGSVSIINTRKKNDE